MKIRFLKAFHGDSILLSFKDPEKINRNILIDGGPSQTFNLKNKKTQRKEPGELQIAIDKINELNEKIDLLILTHIDDDHIKGLLNWFEDKDFSKELIGEIWFNSGKLIAEYFQKPENPQNNIDINISEGTDTSTTQAVKFENYINKKGINWQRRIIKAEDKIDRFGLNFRILSPTIDKLQLLLNKYEEDGHDLSTSKDNDYNLSIIEHLAKDEFEEDISVPNGSSISFIISFNSENFLFLADAHPTVIIQGLNHFKYTEVNPLKAKFVKLSHHGSKKNTNIELLKLIESENYIISTNGDMHSLPDKQCLSRIIDMNPNVNLLFNYFELYPQIFSYKDFIDFKFFVNDINKVFNIDK
jgi:beta-lactamase superfamily II metal-dependent hydrolase